jgi:hypothetical protein
VRGWPVLDWRVFRRQRAKADVRLQTNAGLVTARRDDIAIALFARKGSEIFPCINCEHWHAAADWVKVAFKMLPLDRSGTHYI